MSWLLPAPMSVRNFSTPNVRELYRAANTWFSQISVQFTMRSRCLFQHWSFQRIFPNKSRWGSMWEIYWQFRWTDQGARQWVRSGVWWRRNGRHWSPQLRRVRHWKGTVSAKCGWSETNDVPNEEGLWSRNFDVLFSTPCWSQIQNTSSNQKSSLDQRAATHPYSGVSGKIIQRITACAF